MYLDKPGVWAIAIILIVSIYLWITSNSKVDTKKEEKEEKEVVKQVITPKTDDSAIIAAIVAALESYTGLTSGEYVVRNVRRVTNEESLWAQRARLENLR